MVYFFTICVFLLFYAFIAWRYFEYAFYFLLFYIPFQVALNPPIAGFDIATARLMILTLFAVLVVKNKKNGGFIFPIKDDFIGILLLGLLFWSGVSVFWSENWFWGIRKWLVFASIFPIYWVARYVFNADDGKNGVVMKSAAVITLSSFFVAISAILQFSTQFIWKIDPILHFWSRTFFPIFLGHNFGSAVLSHQSWFTGVSGKMIMRAVGFFPDPHTLGFYIGLIFPVILFFSFNGKKYKILSFSAIFLSLTVIFLTFARSAYLGLFAGLFVFLLAGFNLFTFRKKIFLVCLIILTILFFFTPRSPIAERFTSSFNAEESSNIERLGNWEEALYLIKRNPAHGVGLGSYSLNAAYLRGMDYVNYRLPIYAHNTYLDIWAEMGIIGLWLWFGLFAYVFYKGIVTLFFNNCGDAAIKKLFVCVLASLFWFGVQSFFDTPVFSPRVLPILMIIFALSGFLIKNLKPET